MDEKPSNVRPVRLFSQPAGWILGVLDILRCGGCLLDFRGRVLALNRIALNYLGDGLVLGADRLSATDRATDQRLQGMVGSALALTKVDGANLPVAVQRRCGRPLVVRLVRLVEDGQRAPGAAMLLLLMLDPQMRLKPAPEILTQAFALTRAESDIAIGIVSGKTLGEIAAARGIKIGTVRTHSKAVFSKTQTRGQAELTRVLTRLAFVAPQPEAATLQPSKGNASIVRSQQVIEPASADGGRREP
jgi:DNA-binding CsgD family transcriptional regulator